MSKSSAVLVSILLWATLGKAQSILPGYLLGEWELVQKMDSALDYAPPLLPADQRVQPSDQMKKDGVHYYFYPDNHFQKAVYTLASKELVLGNGKVLSFQDGELVLEVEDFYINGRAFPSIQSMPEMKYDTLNVQELPPLHFRDVLAYPSSVKRGVIVHDTLYFLKLRSIGDE